MDIIIRIIVNIFKELFEQDTNRREAERARRQKIMAQWQQKQRAAQQSAQGPSQKGGPVAQGSASSNLAKQIEALFMDMESQAKEPEPVVPAPPPVPREAMRKPKAALSEPAKIAVRKRSEEWDLKPTHRRRKGSGASPLRQMILAKVMLDPPKALRDDLL